LGRQGGRRHRDLGGPLPCRFAGTQALSDHSIGSPLACRNCIFGSLRASCRSGLVPVLTCHIREPHSEGLHDAECRTGTRPEQPSRSQGPCSEALHDASCRTGTRPEQPSHMREPHSASRLREICNMVWSPVRTCNTRQSCISSPLFCAQEIRQSSLYPMLLGHSPRVDPAPLHALRWRSVHEHANLVSGP
jgi:hypothetical protein